MTTVRLPVQWTLGNSYLKPPFEASVTPDLHFNITFGTVFEVRVPNLRKPVFLYDPEYLIIGVKAVALFFSILYLTAEGRMGIAVSKGHCPQIQFGSV